MNGAVNSDASYEDGLAALAYESKVLGSATLIVRAWCSTEAELMALRMAMAAASARDLVHIVFRADSKSVVESHRIQVERLLPLCCDIADYLSRHEYWRVTFVPRRENVAANILARRALRQVLPKPV